MPSTIGRPKQTGLKPEAIQAFSNISGLVGKHFKSYGKSMLLAQQGVKHADQPEDIRKDSRALLDITNPVTPAMSLYDQHSSGQSVSKADVALTGLDLVSSVPQIKMPIVAGTALVKTLVDVASAVRRSKHMPDLDYVTTATKSDFTTQYKMRAADVPAFNTERAKVGLGPAEEIERYTLPNGEEAVRFRDVRKAGYETAIISDKAATLMPGTTISTPKGIITKNGKLGDIMQHDTLYEIMPELRDLKVVYDGERSVGAAAFGYMEDGTPYISMGPIESGNENKIVSMLLHEVQHRIQDQSFWPVGGSAKGYEKGGEQWKMVQDLMADPNLDTLIVPGKTRLETAEGLAYYRLQGEVQSTYTQQTRHLSTEQLQQDQLLMDLGDTHGVTVLGAPFYKPGQYEHVLKANDLLRQQVRDSVRDGITNYKGVFGSIQEQSHL